MLIDCPACAASYHVGRSEIGDDGRAVVCPRCDTHWFVGGAGDEMIPSRHDLRTSSFSSRPNRAMPSPAEPGESRVPLWRMCLPAASVAAVLVLTMGSIGLRERIVRTLPRTAVLYASLGLPVNVRGLEIAKVVPTRVSTSPGDLSVMGEIRNVTRRRTNLPRLSYEVRDAAGTVLMTWTEHAPAGTIGSGRSLPFVSSPHAIPPDGHSIVVRFASPDTAAPTIRVAGRAD